MRWPISILRSFLIGVMLVGALVFPAQSTAQPPEEGAEPTAGKGHLRFPGSPFAEPGRGFLNRGVWQGYINYGIEPYETYTVSTQSFEVYDRLGNRLLRGYPLLTWQENRSKELKLQESSIFRSAQYWQWFDNLIVFQESHKGWDVGLFIGDKIRTTLTPLTVSRPRWDGLRLDARSASHGLTFLLTRGQARRFSTFQSRNEINPILQYGGRWYSRIGKVLTAGFTFFNQHQADMLSDRGNLLRGTLPRGTEVPTTIFVRVQDDSPEDGTPAQVYAMHIYLRIVQPNGTRTTHTSNPDAGPGGTEYIQDLRPVVLPGARQVGDYYEARGSDEVVDFEFTLPPGAVVDRARFEATVAGDYRISVRQKHPFFNRELSEPDWEERQWPANPITRLHNVDGRPDYPVDFKPGETEAFFILVRAKGNPATPGADAPSEQPRVVSFKYGIPIGQTLIGADFAIESMEMVGRGELVYNWQEHQFPLHSDSLALVGKHFDTSALAGYFTLVRNFGPRLRHGEVALEVFRIDPDYSGGYESRRGGAVFFTDQEGDFETVRRRRFYSGFTQEFELVADNDDNDDWPDDWPKEEGRFQPLQPQVYSGAKAHSGVFPGLDEDGDNSPDTDRNRNGIADWTEPFLLYDSDPPDFVYGIDFNNNGIPDFRENDAEPDYPYRRDSKGYHGFVAIPDLVPLCKRLTVGYFSIGQFVGGGEAKGPYARIQHRSRPRRWLEVSFDDNVKYVRDSIRDDVYVFDITPGGINSGSVLNPPPADPLTMRKSIVNTGLLKLDSRPWRDRNLRLQAQILHFTNKQLEVEASDGTRQESDRITRLTWIGRADYAVDWGKSDLWFGLKYLAREGDKDSLDEPESSLRFFTPIFRLNYPFMANVSFQLGMSGFAWLPMRYTDNVDEVNSYEQNSTILMITSSTDDYLGYSLSTSAGMQWQKIDFDAKENFLDSDTFGFFVETFAGF